MTARNIIAQKLTALHVDGDTCSLEYMGKNRELASLSFPSGQIHEVLSHFLRAKAHLETLGQPGTGWSPCADRMRVAFDDDNDSFIFSFWVNGAELSFMVSRTVGAASVRNIREGTAVH